jgi:hypothetical protein
MKKLASGAALALLVLLIGKSVSGQDINQLTQKELKDGWQLLFDGRSMDKWRCYKMDKVQGWAIEDGAMIALGLPEGKGGDIVTREKFSDFELYLEWKTAIPAFFSMLSKLMNTKRFTRPVRNTNYSMMSDLRSRPVKTIQVQTMICMLRNSAR